MASRALKSAEPFVRTGDLVRTGASCFPQYRVIAISGGRAWLRDVQYGNDSIVPVAGLATISS